MPDSKPNDVSRIRRIPERGRYDLETIHAVIDESLVCHVGFVVDGRPIVIPTIHARYGNRLVFHGAKASRLLKHIQTGNDMCVTMTLVDGLVLARSVFHHSMNYRSVVLFGKGRIVDDESEKLRCLGVLTEHLIPGRWADARLPNRKELNATSLVVMDIDEASAKIRMGPPKDDEEDYTLPYWAGVIPMRQQPQSPIPDDRLAEGIPIPEYLEELHRTRC